MSAKKPFEVETRGPLTKEHFSKISQYFKENAIFIEKKTRFSLLYFRNGFPKDVKKLKKDPLDLRLRITNSKASLVAKYGHWAGSDARKEFEIPISLSDFLTAVEFLKALGWTKALAYSTDTWVYQYQGIEFALVHIRDFGFVYEAEIMAGNKKEVKKAQIKIKKVCKLLGLEPYKKGEFEKQCNQLNNNKKLQFDFKKMDLKKLEKRYKHLF